MYPKLSNFTDSESGIRRVVDAYHAHAAESGVIYVDCEAEDEDRYDILAVHAGMTPKRVPHKPTVSILHGLYWTADYDSNKWEHKANANVIDAIRHSDVVTVPSEWVAETLRRDMHIDPYIVPHGIDAFAWQHNEPNRGYVLWNKNRTGDVCDPEPVGRLALRFPDTTFVTTFHPGRMNYGVTRNISEIGVVPHDQMRRYIQQAGVYLSTTKETFGIGVLEAMAAGIPVLGFAHGGNLALVQHGVNGYLARPGDYDDLARGLEYCFQYRDLLGDNGAKIAKRYTWGSAARILGEVYREAYRIGTQPATLAIVIPSYKYADKVGTAIESAVEQDYEGLTKIIVVDDGSDDGGATERVARDFERRDSRVTYLLQTNSGVAVARNRGVAEADTKYVCCLDADDRLDSRFARLCVAALEADKSLGIAYTGLTYVKPDGSSGLSPWPGEVDYDDQLRRKNQIPTCCVFRKEMWERLGGYRQRYAPKGAGSEDAEYWTRAFAAGFGAKRVTDGGLFIYSWLSGRVSGDKNYQEVDWLYWHPYADKGLDPPFAATFTPKNNFAHPVREYDTPQISVVIPVGPDHEREAVLWQALDSLEGQTFYNWEVIIVYDGVEENDATRRTKRAYPFIKEIYNNPGRGAGAARNLGVRQARAPLLLYLDADDWLYPDALELMSRAWNDTHSIIYTDYDGKAYIAKGELSKIRDYEKRLLFYDEQTSETVLSHKSHDYQCEMAQRQPSRELYIWCLVSCLTPKIWHDEIGGFDEKMPSWEDWDYWIRMARAGKCFVRIPESLVVYRFYTGTRRDRGVEIGRDLIQYLQDKYEGGDEAMPCNCGGRRNNPAPTQTITQQTVFAEANTIMAHDENFVLITYTHLNRGQHKVVGPVTGTNYGYHGGGERFYINKADLAGAPNIFQIYREPTVQETVEVARPAPKPPVQMVEETPEPEPEPLIEPEPFTEPPEPLAEPEKPAFDPQLIPGVTPRLAQMLLKNGVTSVQAVHDLGKEGLMAINGVGEARAEAIMAYADSIVNPTEDE